MTLQVSYTLNSSKNLMDEYFDIHQKYSSQYGKDRTVILIQNGGFHEIYQTPTEGPNLQRIYDLTGYYVTNKNKSIPTIDRKNPYMLGLPSGNVHKLLHILIDAGYTVVVIDQTSPAPKPRREITGVYSSSTYMQEMFSVDKINNSKVEANFLMCVYIEKGILLTSSAHQYIIGLSIIDVSTGKVIIHECISKINNDLYYPLDELRKFWHSYNPTEVVIVYRDFTIQEITPLIEYTEIANHRIYDVTTIKTHTGCENIDKPKYQTEILNNVYAPNAHNFDIISTLELDDINFGRLSLCIALNYINNHNPNILSKIQYPEIYHYDTKVYYGNNIIHQLNIFPVTDIHKKFYTTSTAFRSLYDVINETKTPMGKRFLHDELVEPSTDIAILNQRYKDIDKLIGKNLIDELSIHMNFNDIERLNRRIILGIAQPTEFYMWYQNLQSSIDFFTLLDKMLDTNHAQLVRRLGRIIENINSTFIVENLRKYLLNSIDGQIFKDGIHGDVDELIEKMRGCNNNIDELCTSLNSILAKCVNKSVDTNLIQVRSTEREGHFLSLTKKRADILEEKMRSMTNLLRIGNAQIQPKSLIFKTMTAGTRTKIFAPSLQTNSTNIQEYTQQVCILNKRYLTEYMKQIGENYKNTLPQLVHEIAYWDFILSGAIVAKKYRYIQPIITTTKKSYLNAINLRHPIVERISSSTFIPTTIKLGCGDQDGIILYGLNSAGKSTLMKSIGLSIIMAQIGYWVPAERFEFMPYKSIIARISDGDNIFRGFSSFNVEMIELKAILKRCDENTLVIADEVCRGTEHESSLIIIQSMLEILSRRKCSFITASHLHELATIEKIKTLENVKIYHLHIGWNDKEKSLVHDRELRDGSGSSFYGLMVARYLIDDNEFTSSTEYIQDKDTISQFIPLTGKKQSRYNSTIIMTKCQICGYAPIKDTDIPLETHHIEFQKNCDENGFIDKLPHIHKNHIENLAVLCRSCHDKIDNEQITNVRLVRIKDGAKLEYQIKNI